MKQSSKHHTFLVVKLALLLSVYYLFTRSLFVAMIFYPDMLVSLVLPTIVASISGIAFLMVFEHENLFSFARSLEKFERKSETNFLKRYLHFGKLIASVVIGFIGGPVFMALTVHLLLSNFSYKYLLVMFVSGLSIFISMSFAKGVLLLFLG